MCVCVCLCASVCRIFPLTLSDWAVWCFVVQQCVGCGHHGSVKVISYSSSSNISPHIPCPQHVYISRVGLLRPTQQNAITARPLFLVHSSALPLSQIVWVCRGAGVPLLSLYPSHSLSLPATHRLSADVARGVVLGPDPQAPVCVSTSVSACVSFAPPLPAVMYYRWDLRLSVSASAARRRRKQDARGSTVISQCALFHTIPGQSLYSLHAGPPLDIYMCQQSHSYWPT